jgi:hypothetical protein
VVGEPVVDPPLVRGEPVVSEAPVSEVVVIEATARVGADDRANGSQDRAGGAHGPGAGYRGPLIPAPDIHGPRVRLGVIWAMGLLAALFAGPRWMALLLAPVAGLAALQASRSWRSAEGGRRPIDGIAGAGAAALVVAAAFGAVGLVVAALGVAVAAVVGDRVVANRHKAGRVKVRRSFARTVLLAAIPGAAGAAPVALRAISSHGSVAALALCTYALVYDASAYLVGAGAERPWEGIAAGLASIGAVTVAVAAILVPPFTGVSPWVLGAAAAVLAPLGPAVATVVLGERTAWAPALRRLDALIVLGPVWAVLALALVG